MKGQMLYIPSWFQASNEDDLARLQWIIAHRMETLRREGWKPSTGWLTDVPMTRREKSADERLNEARRRLSRRPLTLVKG